MDSAIRRINHYPLDSAIDFAMTYPLDSIYPADSAIHRLNNWPLEWNLFPWEVSFKTSCGVGAVGKAKLWYQKRVKWPPLSTNLIASFQENSSSDVQPSEDEGCDSSVEQDNSSNVIVTSSSASDNIGPKHPVEVPPKSALKQRMDGWKTRGEAF